MLKINSCEEESVNTNGTDDSKSDHPSDTNANSFIGIGDTITRIRQSRDIAPTRTDDIKSGGERRR